MASGMSYSPQWRSSFLVCGCKGTTFFQTDQILCQLFLKKYAQEHKNRGKEGLEKGGHLIIYYARRGILYLRTGKDNAKDSAVIFFGNLTVTILPEIEYFNLRLPLSNLTSPLGRLPFQEMCAGRVSPSGKA